MPLWKKKRLYEFIEYDWNERKYLCLTDREGNITRISASPVTNTNWKVMITTPAIEVRFVETAEHKVNELFVLAIRDIERNRPVGATKVIGSELTLQLDRTVMDFLDQPVIKEIRRTAKTEENTETFSVSEKDKLQIFYIVRGREDKLVKEDWRIMYTGPDTEERQVIFLDALIHSTVRADTGEVISPGLQFLDVKKTDSQQKWDITAQRVTIERWENSNTWYFQVYNDMDADAGREKNEPGEFDRKLVEIIRNNFDNLRGEYWSCMGEIFNTAGRMLKIKERLKESGGRNRCLEI